VIVHVTAALIVMLKFCVGLPSASVTLTVKLEVAGTVGVPLITPVELLSERLVGNDPLNTLKLGAAHPVVLTV